MYLLANTQVVARRPTIQYMSNLGEAIVKARSAKGWSQDDLARRAGVSQGTIGHLESGRNTSSRKLPDIAQALGMSVEELISGKASFTQTAQEHSNPPPWPFKVSIERVLALPASKLERIEGFILGVLDEHETNTAKRRA